MLGLTDKHIARRGLRIKKGGLPGHIAYDYEYVLSRKPQIIVTDGGGFSPVPNHKFSKQFSVIYQSELYQPVSFYFKEGKNPIGQYVNLLLLKEEKRALLAVLGKFKNVVPAELNHEQN